MGELNQSDACLVIRKAIADVPTWVEQNSYVAQCDMRSRCELAAAEAARDVIAKLVARIAQLESEVAYQEEMKLFWMDKNAI